MAIGFRMDRMLWPNLRAFPAVAGDACFVEAITHRMSPTGTGESYPAHPRTADRHPRHT